MQEEEPGSVRSELLERLRALESEQSQSGLAELSYTRAREALESAMSEAGTIRLAAIEDARLTREREMTALMESMRGLRLAAEAQIDGLVRTAEIEATRLRDTAQSEAQLILQRASNDARQIRDEAQALRNLMDERQKQMERIEADFNRLLADIAERLGVEDKPPEGWWKRITGGR